MILIKIIVSLVTLLTNIKAKDITINLNLGDVTKSDKRFIYPNKNLPFTPIGEQLEIISPTNFRIEPRIKFYRTHEKSCTLSARGHFDTHNEVLFYCGNGKVMKSDSRESGQRHPVKFTPKPTGGVFMIVPMGVTDKVSLVATGDKAGVYTVYTNEKTIASGLDLSADAKFHDKTKLRAVLPPLTMTVRFS